MKTLSIILPTALLAACVTPAQAQEAPCRALTPRQNEKLVVNEAGNACLTADLRIDRVWNLPDGHSSLPDEALVISADNVTLDLQGHAIQSGNKAGGIRIWPPGSSSAGAGKATHAPRQVTIRNGELRSEVGVGIDARYNAMPMLSDRDAPRGIRIEHMRIDARDSKNRNREGARPGAITVAGTGTVIRDCVIETNAGTALWIFGPDAVIENNTIIVHGAAPLDEADAPIRLHHGDGAVIRNNRFVIKDGAHRRGISVFDTGAITVENNTFTGMTDRDEVAKAYTGTLQVKETGSRFEPAWKALFQR